MHNCVLKISYTFSVVVHFRSLSHYFDNQNWSEMPKRGNHIAVAFTIRRRAIRLVQGYSCGKCHTLCVAYTRRVSYIQVILCVSSKARNLAYREEVLQSCHFVLFISTNTVEQYMREQQVASIHDDIEKIVCHICVYMTMEIVLPSKSVISTWCEHIQMECQVSIVCVYRSNRLLRDICVET